MVVRRFSKLTALVLSLLLLFALVWLPPCLNRGAYIYKTHELPAGELKALGSEPGWRLDPLQTEPGIVLPGLVRPTSNRSAPWVLFLPGNGRAQLKSGQSYMNRLNPLAERPNNWGLAVWAMRGYDSAPGHPSNHHLRADFLTIYKHLLAAYNVSPGSLHLVGFSFGSDLALQLAADAARIGVAPASVSLLSTQGKTQTTWLMRSNAWYSRWLPSDRYDLAQAFDHLKSPVLIVEAENDLHGPISWLINVLNSPTRLVKLPGGDHGSSMNEQQALAAVRNWVLQHQN